MKKIFAALFLLAATAFAEGNNLIGDNVSVETTGTGYGKVAILTNAAEPIEFYINKKYYGGWSSTGAFSCSSLNLDNDSWLSSTDAAGTGTLNLLKGNATDDTVLNCDSGDTIILSEDGTTAITIDPSTNGVTFASLAELGSDSVTDGVSVAYFSDGTRKGKVQVSTSFLLGTTTNHAVQFIANNSGEVGLNTTELYPIVNAGSSLGVAANSWGGLFLSDATASGAAKFVSNELRIGTTSNHSWALIYNDKVAWSLLNNGNFSQNVTDGGNIVMAKAGSAVITGAAAYSADLQSAFGAPALISMQRANSVMLQHGVDSVASPSLSFAKSRATDGSADTIVQNNDYLAEIDFRASDGASYRLAGYIVARVDGTPGASDMPGRIEFYTTPDGSATPVERFRIEADGDLTGNATTGGNLVFQRDGYGIIDSTESLAATGNSLATAAALTAVVQLVTGADATKAVKFPTAPIGGQRYVIYNTANAVLPVYPGEAGDQINAAGAGNAVNVAAYGTLYCHASSDSQIWCGELANP